MQFSETVTDPTDQCYLAKCFAFTGEVLGSMLSPHNFHGTGTEERPRNCMKKLQHELVLFFILQWYRLC